MKDYTNIKPGYYLMQGKGGVDGLLVRGPFDHGVQAANLLPHIKPDLTPFPGWVDTVRVTKKGKVKHIARTRYTGLGDEWPSVVLDQRELDRAKKRARKAGL